MDWLGLFGENRLAEHVKGDAVDSFAVFFSFDGGSRFPHSPKAIAYTTGSDDALAEFIVLAMRNAVYKLFKLCHFCFVLSLYFRFVLRSANVGFFWTQFQIFPTKCRIFFDTNLQTIDYK